MRCGKTVEAAEGVAACGRHGGERVTGLSKRTRRTKETSEKRLRLKKTKPLAVSPRGRPRPPALHARRAQASRKSRQRPQGVTAPGRRRAARKGMRKNQNNNNNKKEEKEGRGRRRRALARTSPAVERQRGPLLADCALLVAQWAHAGGRAADAARDTEKEETRHTVRVTAPFVPSTFPPFSLPFVLSAPHRPRRAAASLWNTNARSPCVRRGGMRRERRSPREKSGCIGWALHVPSHAREDTLRRPRSPSLPLRDSPSLLLWRCPRVPRPAAAGLALLRLYRGEVGRLKPPCPAEANSESLATATFLHQRLTSPAHVKRNNAARGLVWCAAAGALSRRPEPCALEPPALLSECETRDGPYY